MTRPGRSTRSPASRATVLGRAVRLVCPRCGDGRLFRGWFRMHDGCPACGLSFAREPGFYLGSIYVTYGVTVVVTGGLYAALVRVAGLSHEAALATIWFSLDEPRSDSRFVNPAAAR